MKKEMKKEMTGRVMSAVTNKWLLGALAVAAIALIVVLTGDGDAMWAAIVPGVAGGKHITGEPLTLDTSREASEQLLVNEIDERVVKIRPMATPIDQISRLAGSRRSGSMKVEYYSVDTLRNEGLVTVGHEKVALKDLTADDVATITVDLGNTVAATETLLLPEVNGEDGRPLVVYVTESLGEGRLKVTPVNPATNSRGLRQVPDIAEGAKVVRMGRAAAELDVQTSQYQAMPVKSHNMCQIFKCQVEQSTLHRLANKEVGWTFSDQEEAAVIDMRLGMEKNFLFGYKGVVKDEVKGTDVMLTEGIWHQAGKEFHYTAGEFTYAKLVELCREAFTGTGASSRKILVGGSGLIEALSRQEHVKAVGAMQTLTKWGLDFTEIVTKFGKLYVLVSETFDQCGRPGDGMVIDPEFITKYVHQPFHTEMLNLRSSGVRNTDAVVITEASCLVLRYPKAHVRIVAD